MQYRTLGRTGLRVPVVAFGTGDTGGVLIGGSQAEQEGVVGHAIECGITLFDTSPDYGKGTAEVNLGRVLRRLDAADALIMTKVEIMPEHLDHIAARVIESVDDSLTRLRRDHVDVVLLHNPCRHQRNPSVRMPWTPLRPEDVLGEVLTGLHAVQTAGKTRFIGGACERAEASAVRQLLDSGAFDMIDVWFNLANPSAGRDQPTPGVAAEEDYTGLLGYAAARGVGVAAIRPLAGGALTAKVLTQGHQARHRLSGGYFSWHPELLEPEIRRGRRFACLDRPGEQTLARAAYRYLLGHAGLSTVIGGFSDISHVDDAVAAVAAGPLGRDDLDTIEGILRDGFAERDFTPPVYAAADAAGCAYG